MTKSIQHVFLLLIIVWSSASIANVHLNIVGRAESGKLMDHNVELKIKMDTGALTSSLNAHDIRIIEKEGKQWVSFIFHDTHTKKEFPMEYPLKRMVRIKKRANEIDKGLSYERRPVIEMNLCLHDEIELIEVNLIDRSHFVYPMLLGRSAMEKFAILIDPTALYTAKPICTVKNNTSTL